jgi:ketosteroid isomerase-like protein
MADNSATVIALDKARMDAMAAQDYAKLDQIIADDLAYTHSSARLDTKETLIGAMKSGATVYKSCTPSDVKAQDLGDTVVLTGRAEISIDRAGDPISFAVRFTDVYAKRGGGWQMVAWQSTKTD